MSLECEHGQLARSCNICEYEREIAELTARVGELEAALTEERQRTRLSETVIRENEALTKENMELVASRDEWKRIAIEAKAKVEDLFALVTFY
jgi:uncharacterized Zn finger protein (UPF0148 family)